MQQFDRLNCLTYFPGSDPNQKGDRFPMKEARLAAQVHKQYLRGRRVILVGRKVAHAFGFPKEVMDFFEWGACEEWGIRFSVIPHTSGCNLYWNDEENRERARKFFQEQIISP